MYINVTESQFHDAFHAMGREDQFSYEGRRALYNYIVELEEDTGEGIELDVIGLCCEFAEYDNITELCADYPHFCDKLVELREEYPNKDDEDDEIRQIMLDHISFYTRVIDVDGEALIIHQEF